MTTGDSYVTDALQLWIYNGNSRSEKLVKSWEAAEFQATLAAQHSTDFKMLVGAYVAALGTRGDYILLKIPVTGTAEGTAVAVSVLGKAYIEIMDVLGVPNDVQLGKVRGYGKYSPFDSPDVKVTNEMKVGIEAERLSVSLTAAVTTNTWVTQKVHGDDDSRIQARFETAMSNGLASNVLEIRLKPTASNVFLVRYDSPVWMLPSGDFYERLDV